MTIDISDTIAPGNGHEWPKALTFDAVKAETDPNVLYAYAGVCEYEPADDKACPACAAYLRAQELEAEQNGVTFKYYLHDNYTRSELAEYLREEGIPKEMAERISETRPFYEITLECKFDPKTERTTILSAK